MLKILPIFIVTQPDTGGLLQKPVKGKDLVSNTVENVSGFVEVPVGISVRLTAMDK